MNSDESLTDLVIPAIELLENCLAEQSEIVFSNESKEDFAEEEEKKDKEVQSKAKTKKKKSKRQLNVAKIQEVELEAAKKIADAKALAKFKKLEGIREHFKRKAADLKHYRLDETTEILGRLYKSLSHHGIEITGESRIRGDHFAFEITAMATGHSAFSGLVLRSDEGFQVGTVKKIIGNHVDAAIRLLCGTLKAK